MKSHGIHLCYLYRQNLPGKHRTLHGLASI